MPVKAPRICKCGMMVAAGNECPSCSRVRKQRSDARRPSATARGYDSRWDKARATYLLSHPYCVMQVAPGRRCGKPANIVDHIVPHRGDQLLFWDKNNWQSLCIKCHCSHKQSHEKRTSGLIRANPFVRPSAIPVTIVCGPAGAGKSTYVRERAGPNDLVIDLDVIRAQLSGGRLHAANSEWTTPALNERNRILQSLAHDRQHERAWFVVSAPHAEDRALWKRKLGNATVVLLDTPLDECIRRIKADPTREGEHRRMEKLARDWWSKQPAPGDNVNFGNSFRPTAPKAKEFSRNQRFFSGHSKCSP